MKPHVPPLLLLMCAVACCTAVGAQPIATLAATDGAPAQLQVARYTTVPAAPAVEIVDPLRATVRISYPRALVTTVGDALRHTLMRTGYRLVDPAALEPEERALLALPLPESQRVLGPYAVDTLLQALLGPAWTLQRDVLRRTVWFTVVGQPNVRPDELPSVRGHVAVDQDSQP